MHEVSWYSAPIVIVTLWENRRVSSGVSPKWPRRADEITLLSPADTSTHDVPAIRTRFDLDPSLDSGISDWKFLGNPILRSARVRHVRSAGYAEETRCSESDFDPSLSAADSDGGFWPNCRKEIVAACVPIRV